MATFFHGKSNAVFRHRFKYCINVTPSDPIFLATTPWSIVAKLMHETTELCRKPVARPSAVLTSIRSDAASAANVRFTRDRRDNQVRNLGVVGICLDDHDGAWFRP